MSTVAHLPAGAAGLPPNRVIALHCSASSGRQWAAYRALLPKDMHLVAPDLMGYGSDAGWPAGASVSLHEEAWRLAPLLQGAPQGVHLVGHSYGGAVALQMALLWPQQVRTLSLYEPVRFGLLLADPQQRAAGLSIVAVGRRIGELARSGRTVEAAAGFVDYWSGDGAWELLPPERRQAIASRMHKVSAEFDALFDDLVPAGAYTRLSMPVRLLTGSRSPEPARAVVDLIAAQCPQAEVVRLPGLGHMSAISHPQAVVPHLAFQPAAAPLAQAA